MSKQNILITFLVLVFGWSSMVVAEQTVKRAFAEGLEYQRIDPPQATQNEDARIEIVELFLYACPHCNTLEPKLAAWVKDNAESVVLRRIPAIVGAPWADQARVFYTAEKLGILDKAHHALFKSIHEDGEKYTNEATVMQFFVNQGVTPDDFMEAFRSPDVDEKVSQARVMTVKYGIRGVPAVIVNGKYRTAQYFTGTQEKLFDVLDMLVEKERRTQISSIN